MSSNSQAPTTKILVCGCIASGKTSLANRILCEHPDWDYVSIDQLRNALSDGTPAGEAIAQQSFADAISKDHNAIVEFTGFGEEGERVFQALRNFKGPIMLLLLRVPVETSIARLVARAESLSFPDYSEKLERMVYSVYFKFVSGTLVARWAEMPGICMLQHDSMDNDDQKFILETVTRFIQSQQ